MRNQVDEENQVRISKESNNEWWQGWKSGKYEKGSRDEQGAEGRGAVMAFEGYYGMEIMGLVKVGEVIAREKKQVKRRRDGEVGK